jgi:hypothetical protein
MPNKATSKAQFRLFKGIATGSIPPKNGLTRSKADEMLGGQSPKGLPNKAKAKVKKKAKKAHWSDKIR